MPPSQEVTSPDSTSLAPHEKEELAAFVELLYWRNGTVPTVAELNSAFDLRLTARQLDAYLSQPKIKQYLINKRGVPLNARARLTAKQLDWIRVATDASDVRPVALKMKDLNVTRSDLTKWQSDKFFQQVMYEQGTRSFQNARFGVLRSLAVEAMNGNVTAQKIYLEMTGDYNATQKVDINVTHEMRQTINVVLDILQRHCSPEVIEAVAVEIEKATIPGLPGAAPIDLPLPVATPSSVIQALPKPKRKVEHPTIQDIANGDDDW